MYDVNVSHTVLVGRNIRMGAGQLLGDRQRFRTRRQCPLWMPVPNIIRRDVNEAVG